MSGVAIVNAILSGTTAVTDVVLASRIITGDIPLETTLPAISVMEISSVQRLTASMADATVLVTDRVQVTVHASTYALKKSILELVRLALNMTDGTVGGTHVNSILPDLAGPDLDDPVAGYYTQSRDFIVKFTGIIGADATFAGGSSALVLTGYIYGNGGAPLSASTTIPVGDITGLGTMATQNANAVAITGGTATLSSLTVPLAIGGGAVGSALELRSTSGVGTTDYIKFAVGNNGGTEAMRIIDSGKVGIGTASPDSLLSVHGAGTWIAEFLGSAAPGYGFLFGFGTNLGRISTNGGSTALSLEIDGTEKMRLASSGNLLVGTQTDTASAGLIQLATGTTAANGIVAGTDARLYRDSAAGWKLENNLKIGGDLTIGTLGGTRYLTGGSNASTTVLKIAADSAGSGGGISLYGSANPTAANVISLTTGTIEQVRIAHTASADRYITMTGSNGGNPTIGVSAGSLAISPNVVMAGSLTTNGGLQTFSANDAAGAGFRYVLVPNA